MRNTRRTFLRAAGAATVAGAARGAAPKHPNILFIFADQLRSHELGCYGNPNIQTPNLDRLAREGARFSNAVSTFPLCSPFRAMLLTGKYPMANGMTVNDHFLNPGMPSFAQALRDAGYQTGYIGKWHIDGRGRTSFTPPERRFGFDFWMALECTHNYFRSQYFEGDSDQPKFWDGYDAVAQTRAAQRYIRERAGRGPFALFLSWGPPHGPYVAPPEFMKRHSPETMKLRPNVADRRTGEFLMANRRTRLPQKFLAIQKKRRAEISDERTFRQWYAGYYAATECLDGLIGDLRQTLAEMRILENTIVVFTSDHGDMLGSHGLLEKTTPFEESISIPFLISYPRRIAAGSMSDAQLTPVDMMPTVLSLAGLKCPKVDGVDLSRHATGRKGPERDAVLLMAMTAPAVSWIVHGVEPWRGVRTKTHTYARFADGRPWLLYNNMRDPFQTDNLIEREAGLRGKLEARMRELLEEAGDPCDTRAIEDVILRRDPDLELIRLVREANPPGGM